jgi:vacuolar-type H+-ATPase subunit E/Vma4
MAMSQQHESLLAQSTLDVQRLAAETASRIRAELKGVYEGHMAKAAKEQEEALEALRAELRKARAEAKRLAEDGKDAEAELMRLRRRAAALEEERDRVSTIQKHTCVL